MVIPDDHHDIFRTRGTGRTAHLPAGVVLNVSSFLGVHCLGISLNCTWAFPKSAEQSCSPQHVFWASDRQGLSSLPTAQQGRESSNTVDILEFYCQPS